MRTIALCSVGALLLGASAIGCYDEPEQPAARSTAIASPPPQQGGSVTVVHHDDAKGATMAQPTAQPAAPQAQPNTPVINNFVTSPPPTAGLPATTPPQDTTAAQPSDDRSRASQVVAEATQQIDRITRVLSMSVNDKRHADIEAAVGQLQAKRERVLKDMKALETTGASSSDDTQHIILNRDVSDLQAALRDSYQYAPPSTQ